MNELDYYITRLEGGESKMRLCMSINIDTLHGIKMVNSHEKMKLKTPTIQVIFLEKDI